MNDFSTIKTFQKSRRIDLVRIQGARSIGGDLSLVSGTTYETTFVTDTIHKMKIDGVEYTEVSSSPASQEYVFEPLTKKLTINLGVAYSSQYVVAFYYLFFSKNEAVITNETPTNSSSINRIWNPRIKNVPRTKLDSTNITDGKLEYSSSALSLHNQDHYFEQFIGVNDSFANKEIKIWVALDEPENVQISFSGIITGLRVGLETIIDFDDIFSLLDKTYYPLGSYANSNFNTTSFPDIQPTYEGNPIREIFGNSSIYKVVEDDVSNLLYKVAGDEEFLLRSVCTDYDKEIITSNNREWATCLNKSSTNLTYGITSVDNTDANFTVIEHDALGTTFYIGETINVNSKYVQIKNVDNSNGEITVTKDASIVDTDDFVRPFVSIVIIQNDDNGDKKIYYPLYGRDFSVSNYGGIFSQLIKVTFNSSLESNLSMVQTLDPELDFVGFIMYQDDYVSNVNRYSALHGDVLEEILTELGLDVNSASITTANTTTLYTDFYSPAIEETVFDTFRILIENIVKSTLGYLTINNDLEIVYSLFDAPSSSLDIRNGDKVLHKSVNVTIDYTKLYDSLTPKNKHNSVDLDFTNDGVSNDKTTYLHEFTRNREFDHVLLKNTRVTDIINLIGERKLLLSYNVTTLDLDTVVGQNVTLNNLVLPNNVSSMDVKILGINKDENKVLVEVTDLLGL